jgi:hypothetical protein
MKKSLNKTLQRTFRQDNTAKNAWIAFGGLVALGIIVMTIREIPSMRRELKLLRM